LHREPELPRRPGPPAVDRPPRRVHDARRAGDLGPAQRTAPGRLPAEPKAHTMTTPTGPNPVLNCRADVQRVLADLAARLDADAETNIGFPATLGLDYGPLLPFFNRFINNLGDPFAESAYPRHT